MPNLQRSVLSRRTFTEIVIANYDPCYVLGFVFTRCRRYGSNLSSQHIRDLVLTVVLSVCGSYEEIVRDVVEMTTILQPRTGS